ncbi:MAG: TPR end-of-group domain-containing protein, partial [Ignavibacteria bacterium]
SEAILCFLDGKTEQGLEALNLLETSGRHDAEQIYNFSNLYGLYGQKEDCFRLLQKAIKKGFYNYQLIEKDPFFNAVRNDGRFKDLVADAKIRHEEFIKNLTTNSLLD